MPVLSARMKHTRSKWERGGVGGACVVLRSVGRGGRSNKVDEQRPDGSEGGREQAEIRESSSGQENGSVGKCTDAEKRSESSRNGEEAGTG